MPKVTIFLPLVQSHFLLNCAAFYHLHKERWKCWESFHYKRLLGIQVTLCPFICPSVMRRGWWDGRSKSGCSLGTLETGGDALNSKVVVHPSGGCKQWAEPLLGGWLSHTAQSPLTHRAVPDQETQRHSERCTVWKLAPVWARDPNPKGRPSFWPTRGVWNPSAGKRKDFRWVGGSAQPRAQTRAEARQEYKRNFHQTSEQPWLCIFIFFYRTQFDLWSPPLCREQNCCSIKRRA